MASLRRGPLFTVVRDGHAIVVEHGGRHPDGAEQVVDRFEESHERRGRARLAGDDTIGYR